MKKITSIFLSSLFYFPLAAQEKAVSPGPDQRVIIIDTNKDSGTNIPPAPFVESGSTIIAGLPDENLKVAYRSWEQKCEAWKKELKMNNAGNLLIADCGQANRRVEKIQLTNYFIIESKSSYKIKVGCSK